jgi:hypothetical protein
MAYFLDIIGSFAIGAAVILMIIRFNQSMITASNESIIYNIAQINTTQVSQILEYDFFKIGFRVDNEDKFRIAKKSDIQFYSDYDDDGNVDTLRYFLSDTSALSSTVNPNDKILYRSFNGGEPDIISPVLLFELAYTDSVGNEITPISQLNSAAKRRNIRGIDIHIYIESPFPIDGKYQGAEWKRSIVLKNIY